MRCAEVNCHETATTLSQLQLGDARFALPACALHDVGDLHVAPSTPADDGGPGPVRAAVGNLAENTR